MYIIITVLQDIRLSLVFHCFMHIHHCGDYPLCKTLYTFLGLTSGQIPEIGTFRVKVCTHF